MPRLSESYRVLIVEDNADTLESLRLQMELWGTEVSTANSAEEALEVAAQFRPQIVLCDIGLPGMDGLRLVEPLRRRAEGHAGRLRRGDRLCQRRGPATRAGGRLRLVLRQAAQPGSLANLLRSYPPGRLSGAARRAGPQRTSSRAPGSVLSGSPSSAAYSFSRL